MLYVHRLLALMFIDNPNNFKYVHHKDGDKLNNNLDNLEWLGHVFNAGKKFVKEDND